MLAALLFTFPIILGACGAAAAPVIIHLIMRTKPRPMIFPALRFVRKTHKANLSRLRLKQIILLLMRMAIILLIAMLIARGRISGWRSVDPPATPIALAIVVDNSGSMGYLRDGKTLLERGKRMATQLISQLPENSRAAVISAAAPRSPAAFLSDRKVVAQQVWDVPATDGHFSVVAALAEAVSAVRDCSLERKQVCVITDLTAQGWRDREQLARADNVRFVLLNCLTGEDTNMSLGPLHLSAAAVPVSAVVRLESNINSSRVGGQVKLRVELDGREVTEQSHQILPGMSAPVSATVSPARAGVVHGRMILDYTDPLAMDNVRYFTLLAARPSKMLILRDPTTIGRGDRTTQLISAAIASASNSAGRQWIRKVTISADRLARSHLNGTDVVLVSNVSSLTPTQWHVLESYVYDGGRLWIVAGPLMSGPAYTTADAQRLMPLALEAQEALGGGQWAGSWAATFTP